MNLPTEVKITFAALLLVVLLAFAAHEFSAWRLRDRFNRIMQELPASSLSQRP